MVYVVTDNKVDVPFALFIVKGDAIDWINSRPTPDRYSIISIDGGWQYWQLIKDTIR